MDAVEEAPSRARALRLAQELAEEIGHPFCSVRFNVAHGKVRNLSVAETWHLHDEEVVGDAVRAVVPKLEETGGIDAANDPA